MERRDPGTGAPPPFRLVGAERSYFSAKARAAFRAKRVSFEEILPTPAAMADLLRRTGLLFLPTVVTPEDETWQDTSDIIDALEARVPEPALIPRTPVQRVVAYLVELYADEFLVLPALHYRWSTPEGERDARDAFVAASGDAESANGIADQMRGWLPLVGVTPGTIPALVAHTGELMAHLESLLADQRFLLGAQPSLADCALLALFYAHLYLDLVPGRLLRERAPRVSHWVERMNHPEPATFAGFRPDDTLHPALLAILALIGSDAAPLVLDTVGDFERWADEQPGDGFEPPRGVGGHRTRLRGVELSRYTSSYTLWMLQRPLDAYRAIDADARAAVDRALSGSGCERLLAYRPRHRLAKRRFQLVGTRL